MDSEFANLHSPFDEEWHPCSAVEEVGITLLTFCLGIAPVVALVYFAVTK
jgi:hypothetical protein